MMGSMSSALWQLGFLAARGPLPRQPPSADNRASLGNGQIDHGHDVIGVSLFGHRYVCATSAGPPNSIDAEAWHFKEPNLPGRRRNADCVATSPAREGKVTPL